MVGGMEKQELREVGMLESRTLGLRLAGSQLNPGGGR